MFVKSTDTVIYIGSCNVLNLMQVALQNRYNFHYNLITIQLQIHKRLNSSIHQALYLITFDLVQIFF